MIKKIKDFFAEIKKKAEDNKPVCQKCLYYYTPDLEKGDEPNSVSSSKHCCCHPSRSEKYKDYITGEDRFLVYSCESYNLNGKCRLFKKDPLPVIPEESIPPMPECKSPSLDAPYVHEIEITNIGQIKEKMTNDGDLRNGDYNPEDTYLCEEDDDLGFYQQSCEFLIKELERN